MTGPRTQVAFEKAAADGRAALVGYLPAGFPDVEGGIAALRAMVDAGCDVIEIGLPYSDPVMDGPTIQAAAQQALEGGVRIGDVLRTVEAVAATGTPTLVMTYWNPIERYGVPRFAARLVAAIAHEAAAAGQAGRAAVAGVTCAAFARHGDTVTALAGQRRVIAVAGAHAALARLREISAHAERAAVGDAAQV